MEITVERLNERGHGVGRLFARCGPGSPVRWLEFVVPRALPKERVVGEVKRVHRNRFELRVLERLSSSPDRQAARCEHFEVDDAGLYCGGCALQHLSYPEQLAVKASRVSQLLTSAGVCPSRIEPPVGVDDPWFYRNKMEYSFGTETDGRYALGLHPPGRRWDILRLEMCLLQSEASAELMRAARHWGEAHRVRHFHPATGEGWLRTLTIREGKNTGSRMVELTTAAAEEVGFEDGVLPNEQVAQLFCDWITHAAEQASISLSSVYWTQHIAQRGQRTHFVHRCLHGDRMLAEVLRVGQGPALRFDVHPRAFFQPNTLQAQRLYAEVIAAAAPDVQGRLGDVLDLYCGTGTIALCLASYARSVTGIELVEEAVINARQSATNNGLENTTFYAGDVGEVLAQQRLPQRASYDAVVVDPPRAGLMPGAIEQLTKLRMRRLVYVSCNPEALARDLPKLSLAGFAVESVKAVDMFPQTAHIETVVALRREGVNG